jgi:chromosome segregation ATPase
VKQTAELQAVATKLQAAQEEVFKAAQNIKTAESASESTMQSLADLQELLAAKQLQAARLTEFVESTQAELQSVLQRKEQVVSNLEAKIAGRNNLIRQHSQEQDALRKQISDLAAEKNTGAASQLQLEAKVSQLEQAIVSNESDREQLTSEVAQLREHLGDQMAKYDCLDNKVIYLSKLQCIFCLIKCVEPVLILNLTGSAAVHRPPSSGY